MMMMVVVKVVVEVKGVAEKEAWAAGVLGAEGQEAGGPGKGEGGEGVTPTIFRRMRFRTGKWSWKSARCARGDSPKRL